MRATQVSLKNTPLSLNSTQVSLSSSPVSLMVSIYVGGCSCLASLACMFGSHGSHVWLACLACLARMARTFGSLARTLATLHLRLPFLVLAQIHWRFSMRPCIPSGNVAPMFYPLLCTSFAIKSNDCGQDFHFCHKMKHKAADKALKKCFLQEFKI